MRFLVLLRRASKLIFEWAQANGPFPFFLIFYDIYCIVIHKILNKLCIAMQLLFLSGLCIQ